VLAAAFLSWLGFAREWLRRRRLGPGTVAAMIVAAVMSLFVQLMPQEDGLLAHLPQYRLGSRGMPLQWHTWNIERPDRHGYDWSALTADLTLALGAVLAVGVVVELPRRRTLGPPKNDQTGTEPAAGQPGSPNQAKTL